MTRQAKAGLPFLLLLGLCAAGCGLGQRGGTEGQASSSGSASSPSLSDVKPDFVFDASAWHEEWKKDRQAAKARYDGKVIELTGEVVYVFVEMDGLRSGPGGMVNLKDEKRGPVTCITTDPQPWLTVIEGCKLRIRGRAGKRDGEELADCVIVESSRSAALTVSAEQLARDVAADRAAAATKYGKKFVHVTGTITAVTKDKDGTIRLALKGASGVGVKALLGLPAIHRAGTIEAGQSITLFGETLMPSGAKEDVSLSGCLVTRKPAK